jgi:hypothetical protein
MKYGNPKASDEEIDNMILDIQSECLLLANDELYEIEDTLKKLGVNENNTVNFN